VATLKKVNPYRSIRAQRTGGVYHDRTDCPTGRQLHSESLAAGSGSLPRCPECSALDEDATAPAPPAEASLVAQELGRLETVDE
jgi:hypothetical protein